VRPFPWWLIYLAAPFVVTLREMLEMRYLWRQPVRMDNARLMTVLGSEPHTPWMKRLKPRWRVWAGRRAQAAANHYLREQVRIFTPRQPWLTGFFMSAQSPQTKYGLPHRGTGQSTA
jgi:hypothetical protein